MSRVRKGGLLLAALAAAWSISARAQETEPTANPKIEELRKAADAEPDQAKKEELWKQLSDAEYADNERRIAELHDRWKNETDPEKRRDLAEELSDLGVKVSNYRTGGNYDQPADLVIEVATDGQYAEKEIKLPDAAEPVRLHEIRTFAADPDHQWVVRRMTKNRFEVWLPRHGWLFDEKGKLTAEAAPPRRDGTGREWYGAFLPDGRWVTTDLFENDKTLTFFTRAGKWLKEIKADALVPRGADDDQWSLSTISWARCTRDGEAFAVSVGQNGGRGVAVVKWSGEHRVLGENENPWQLCYPRDLEPKGMYTMLATMDDRGVVEMSRQEDGHGVYVGFPVYEAGNVYARIPEGETFGFWPGSENVYVVVDHQNVASDEAGGLHTQPSNFQTWFYNADGKFAGWVAAKRIADMASGDGMLFLDRAQRVVALTADYRVDKAEQFTWDKGAAAEPVKLFPDLRLGCFLRDKKLVLASW
jgi:hypothetical protein